MLAVMLLAPIVSKNPIIQDTVRDVNLHFTFGVRPGNYIQEYGPEIGLKFEYLLVHPVIIRSSVDFNSAYVNNDRYPNGRRNSIDLAIETLIYGGRKRLSSFLGIGLVYSLNSFNYENGSGYGLEEFIISDKIIDETEIEDKYGYRLIMGFRFHEIYSIEFGYQESRPNFTINGHDEKENFTIYKSGRTSTVRLTVGYLIPL
jgi:hypothetical protein